MSKDEGCNRVTVRPPDLEPDTGHEPVGKEETPRFTSPVTIRVISYRRQDHDTDGISVKAVLDGIVKGGLLPDDKAKYVKKITFESRKNWYEKTIIEIEEA